MCAVPVRKFTAVVVEFGQGRAVLEAEDGSRREVSAPAEIEITVGMHVRVVDVGDDAPILAWGV